MRQKGVSLSLCGNRMSSIVYKAFDRLISRAAVMFHTVSAVSTISVCIRYITARMKNGYFKGSIDF